MCIYGDIFVGYFFYEISSEMMISEVISGLVGVLIIVYCIGDFRYY